MLALSPLCTGLIREGNVVPWTSIITHRLGILEPQLGTYGQPQSTDPGLGLVLECGAGQCTQHYVSLICNMRKNHSDSPQHDRNSAGVRVNGQSYPSINQPCYSYACQLRSFMLFWLQHLAWQLNLPNWLWIVDKRSRPHLPIRVSAAAVGRRSKEESQGMCPKPGLG